MKKMTCLLVVVLLLACFAACDGEKITDDATDAETTTQALTTEIAGQGDTTETVKDTTATAEETTEAVNTTIPEETTEAVQNPAVSSSTASNQAETKPEEPTKETVWVSDPDVHPLPNQTPIS